MDLSYYLIVSFCVLLFSISKSGFSGGGLALISVAVLSINFGPLRAISILLPLLLVCDAIASFLNRRYFDKKRVLGLMPYTLIGVIIGTILFKNIDLNIISILIGSLSLAYVTFNYLLENNNMIDANIHFKKGLVIPIKFKILIGSSDHKHH